MSMSALLEEISDYCVRASTAPSTFGRRAVGDPSFVSRLQSGGECLPRTMEKVRAYMRANPPQATEAEASETNEAA